MWRMLRRMFGRHRPPPRDPSVDSVVHESHSEAKEVRELLDQIRESAERRRLANATRVYEERLHGTRGN